MIGSRVDPALAHKRHEANSWLTAYRITGVNEMEAAFRLPSSVTPTQLSALMEVWRQAGLVFAHTVLHVPMDDVFALASISLQVRDPGTWPNASQQGTLQISDCDCSIGPAGVRAATAAVRMQLDHGRILEGRLSAKFLPTRIYARLRAASLNARSEAAASNPASGGAGEITDLPTHGLLTEPFADHAHDHVTAMSIVAAVERTAGAGSNAVLCGLDLEFRTYIDAYPAPEVTLTAITDGQFIGVATQLGRIKATFSGSVSPDLPLPVTEVARLGSVCRTGVSSRIAQMPTISDPPATR